MIATPHTSALPHWDLTAIYPSLASEEYTAARAELAKRLDRAEQRIGEIAGGRAADTAPSATVAATFDAWIDEWCTIGTLANRLDAYLELRTAVDTRDEEAAAEYSTLRQRQAQMAKIGTRFTAWAGTLDIDTLIAVSAKAKEHEFFLRTAQIDAEHLMDQPLEDLAAELNLSGGSAWATMFDEVTSQIAVTFERTPGQPEQLPITDIRNLAMDPDREVRRRAWEAELAAWQQWETPVAAALNGIKGEHTTVARRRHWPDVLDESLHQNAIDREVLDAMMGAAQRAFPDLRRYLNAKARALGLEKLAWYDLFAPLSANDRVWEWDEAVAFLLAQFGTYSDRMHGLAQRAFDERWIDAEPRPGKVGGAFCTGVHDDVSRILSNYTPAWDGVNTLAHELGHAYHNLAQAGRSHLQVEMTPMTLAETASTFCETILRKAAIASGTDAEALAILEASLQDATQVLVDISSRYLFEQAVFARRAERELSASEFSDLMLQAQRDTYGDGLDANALHPYMWAVKGHYYSPRYAYYNYPYMFGLLFGLGLYAHYEKDPDTFRANYDELLASTGAADAATLAARFGFDIRSADFWEGSLDVIREDIQQFVTLVDRGVTT